MSQTQTVTSAVGKVQARLSILRADLRSLFSELRAAGMDEVGSYELLRKGLTATDHYTLVAAIRCKDAMQRKGVWVDRPDFDDADSAEPKEAA